MARLSAVAALLFLVLITAPGAARADYARGIAAYGRADYRTALTEFSQGAVSGDPEAEHMLGRLYQMGLGVPQDFVQAWVWQERAASHGNKEANDARVTLEGVMTPAQLAQARAVAVAPLQPAPPVPIIDVGSFPPVHRPGQQLAIGPGGMPVVETAPQSGAAPPPQASAPPQPAPPQSPDVASEQPQTATAGDRTIVLVPRQRMVVTRPPSVAQAP